MSKPETTDRHSKAWRLGYRAAKEGLTMSQMGVFPGDETSDFNAGYAVGARDKRSDALMAEWGEGTCG